MNKQISSYSLSDALVWPVFVCLLVSALLLAGCGDNSPAPTATATLAPLSAEVGGMAITVTPANMPPAAAQETPAATSVAPAPQEVLAPETPVVAGGVLRFYADADPTALRLAEYAAGTTFVVVEPGDDYGVYPVDMNGVRWYRVRADDGLVGWVMADAVSPLAQ